MNSSIPDMPMESSSTPLIPDQNFEPFERLFWRIDEIKEERIDFTSIRFPVFSVNREKYSKPEDVLRPSWLNWGIAAFYVKDIRMISMTPENSLYEYSYNVFHNPLIDNYAHSEVRTLKNGVYNSKLKTPNSVKLRFRMQLRDEAIILKKPME
ncbi:MAG: hypothetical protein AB1656_16255 [Candidatus Omnitrophota bacterium]